MSEMVKISDTEWVKTSGNVDYSEINEIKDSLTQLAEGIKWKLHSEVTSTTQVTLPSEFNELLLFGYANATTGSPVTKIAYSIVVSRASLDSSGVYVHAGGATTSVNMFFFQCLVYSTKVNMISLTFNGNDLTSSAKLQVFYR